jgi:hypothetical protein
MKIFDLGPNTTQACDGCTEVRRKATKALRFNDLGDYILMCDEHYVDLHNAITAYDKEHIGVGD